MASWKRLRVAVALAVMFLGALGIASNMDAFEEQHQLNRDSHVRGMDHLPALANRLIARGSPETPTEVPPVSTIKGPSASCSATNTKEITIHTSVPSTKGSLCSTEAVPTSTVTVQLPSCSAPCTEETTIVVGPTVESSLTPTEKPPASTKTSVQVAPTQEVPTTLCTFVSGTKTTVAWSVSSTTSQQAHTETESPTHSSLASTIETTHVTTTTHGPSATGAHANSASRSGHLIFHLFILGLFLVLFDAL